MNPIGVVLLILASLFTIGTAMLAESARVARGWGTPSERRANLRAAWSCSMAAAWCLSIGLWLVVTR